MRRGKLLGKAMMQLLPGSHHSAEQGRASGGEAVVASISSLIDLRRLSRLPRILLYRSKFYGLSVDVHLIHKMIAFHSKLVEQAATNYLSLA